MNNDEKERRLNPDSVSADQPTTTSTDTDSKDTNAPDDNNNNDTGRVVSGYGLKFDTPSRPLGDSDAPFTEVIAPDALDGVDLSNVLMLNDHDYKDVLAKQEH